MTGRPDLGTLTVGAVYRDERGTGELVEFLGVAVMAELAGEDVGVFRFVEGGDGALLIATQRDYDNGQVFVPIGDEITDDLGDEA